MNRQEAFAEIFADRDSVVSDFSDSEFDPSVSEEEEEENESEGDESGEEAKLLRASAWETGADLEMKVSRFCSKSVHKVVMWTYVTCQSFSFIDFCPAEFWISAPQGSSKANFQYNFGHFSISVLATYN